MYSKIKVVCLGGGTGLPGLLSGLKHNPWLDITAVVSMFDSGGSSGELRDRFGILPPGDVLKCLLALSKNESYARETLLKRIPNKNIPGHTGGNALLLGLEKVYGDCTSAIGALGRLLSIRGKVIPVSLCQSTLCARYVDGSTHKGETSVDLGMKEGKVIEKIFLDPPVPISADAYRAIIDADVICVGPGSLYTSVLPNFLPDKTALGIGASKAKIIYIANLLTEGKGMAGLHLKEIIAIVEHHVGRSVDYVIANNHWPMAPESESESIFDRYAAECKYPIVPEREDQDPRIILADLWIDLAIARHDCSRLAHLVSAVINVAVNKIPLLQTASPSAL